METKVRNTLEAFITMELIKPINMSEQKKIPKIKLKNGKYISAFEKVFPKEKQLPWHIDHKKNVGFKQDMKYRVSIGMTTHNKIVQLLRDTFEIDDEIINESWDEISLASFDIIKVEKIHKDDTKTYTYRYIEKSFSISPFTYYLSNIAKTDFKNIVRYAEQLSVYYEEKYMEKLPPDVTLDDIFNLDSVLLSNLFKNSSLFQQANNTERFIYIERRPANKPEQLPSFFIEDLTLISESNSINQPLIDYLCVNEQNRVDIDKDIEAKTDWIDLKHLPLGRWPSPLIERPYFMQQISVNILTSAESKNKVRSVNGPPGTGKTTLLKDVFADVIVKRAQALTKNRRPFKRSDLNGKPYYSLPKDLLGFSIVVASSNNGAVENISRDLPTTDEVVTVNDKNNDENDQNPYDEKTAELIEKLDFFRLQSTAIANKCTIQEVLEDEEDMTDSWGLISAPLGNSTNISDFFTIIKDILDNKVADTIPHNWDEAVKEFNLNIRLVEERKNVLRMIIQKQNKLNILLKNQASMTEQQENLSNELEVTRMAQKHLEGERFDLQALLDTQKASLFDVFTSQGRDKKQKREAYTNEYESTINKHRESKNKSIEIEDQLEQLTNRLQEIVTKNDEVSQLINQRTKDFTNVTATFFDNYEEAQLKTPYLDEKLQYLRSNVFVAAIKVHMAFIKENSYAIACNLKLLKNRKSINLNTHRDSLVNLWETLHLVCPVVSTTFASLSNMYRGLRAGEIGYLVIDEAGQAIPQAAVGGIWRARQIIAVGDPIQIEPVMTMDQTIYTDIIRHFELDEKYFSPTASVQSIADLINPYGTEKDKEWIGIPLWVHRRCKQPMFSIANSIAYNDKMVPVHGSFKLDDDLGESRWIDCKGKVPNGKKQVIQEQVQVVFELVKNHMEKLEADQHKEIFIITPFTEVKSALISKMKYIKGFDANSQIGTVHTFQGKEAHTVFFIPGLDDSKTGAIQWLTSKPNILNVAVTRAKDRFIIIGDYDLLKTYDYLDKFASTLTVEHQHQLNPV